MTITDIRNITLWYQDTVVQCRGYIIRLNHLDERDGKMYICGKEVVSGEPTDLVIKSIDDIEPVDFRPRMVNTSSPVGDIFLGRKPMRTAKKSLNTGIVRTPAYLEGLGSSIPPVRVRLSLDTLVATYAGRRLIKYSPEEAARRVGEGVAMFSAITEDVSVGALPGKRGYVCTRRDKVVGVFHRPVMGAPDVKRLILSRPFEHLADSMSVLFREVCVK